MRLLISMIGMNRCDGTREAVEAVLASSEPFHLSLTNQNSSDGTAAYFNAVKARFPDRATVFHEDRNTFFQPPNNRAYHLAATMGCEFFLCLNDDAIIPRDGLAKMMAVMDARPNVAVVGAAGGCEELSPAFHGQPGRLDFVEGSCAMYRIAHMRRHRPTLFWDRLEGIYSEDSEASLFLRERGHKIAKADFDLPHSRSSTVNRDPATQSACRAFQDRNHELCKARYAHWIKVRRFDFPIVIERKMALGDVILMTPIIRAIRKSNPMSPIYVQTDFTEVFDHNPNVVRAQRMVDPMKDELRINLDGAYENRPMAHILDAYAEVTRQSVTGIGEIDWRTELFPSEADMGWAGGIRNRLVEAHDGSLCLLHAGPSHWPGKHWDAQKFEHVAHGLKSQGWTVACVGSMDKPAEIRSTHDLTGQTTLLKLVALARFAQLFVGIDSAPLHIAQASGCPSVGIFGVTSSRFIATHGSKFMAVEASGMESAGLRHRGAGSTFVSVGKDAMDSIAPEQVMDAIERMMK